MVLKVLVASAGCCSPRWGEPGHGSGWRGSACDHMCNIQIQSPAGESAGLISRKPQGELEREDDLVTVPVRSVLLIRGSHDPTLRHSPHIARRVCWWVGGLWRYDGLLGGDNETAQSQPGAHIMIINNSAT